MKYVNIYTKKIGRSKIWEFLWCDKIYVTIFVWRVSKNSYMTNHKMPYNTIEIGSYVLSKFIKLPSNSLIGMQSHMIIPAKLKNGHYLEK